MPVRVETYATAAEAARALSSGRRARYLAGGTVVMRAVNDADPSFDTLVRSTDPALREIRAEGAGVRVGAGVTMAEIVRHRDTAFLAPVARLVGGPQVRSAATVAGNLFCLPPYGDFAAALLALDAVAETADGRRIALAELLRAGAAHPLLAALLVPRRPVHFKKVTRVKPKGVSLLSIAAVLPGAPGRIEGARIVMNGMGERPARAQGAERALEGQPLDAAAIARAAAAAASGFEPRDDSLASAWYRREVAGIHLARLLTSVR